MQLWEFNNIIWWSYQKFVKVPEFSLQQAYRPSRILFQQYSQCGELDFDKQQNSQSSSTYICTKEPWSSGSGIYPIKILLSVNITNLSLDWTVEKLGNKCKSGGRQFSPSLDA